MMSRKNYQDAARRISAAELDPYQFARITDLFADFFAADNPRFNRTRFLAACGQPKEEQSHA